MLETKFKVGDLVECQALESQLWAVVVEVYVGWLSGSWHLSTPVSRTRKAIFCIVRDEEGDMCDFNQDDLRMVAPA